MATVTGGGVTIQGVWVNTPANRLSGYAPQARVVGQRRTLLASGAPRVWAYRDPDQTASFTIKDIPNTALEDCLTLAAHIDGGGTFEVDPEDGVHVYPNCVLAPGAETPQPTLSDAQALRYSMDFGGVLNLDGDPILAVYT